MNKIAAALEDPEQLDESTVIDYITSLRDFKNYSPITNEGQKLFNQADAVKKFLEKHQKSLTDPKTKSEIAALRTSIHNLVTGCVEEREEQKMAHDKKESAAFSFRETLVKADTVCLICSNDKI